MTQITLPEDEQQWVERARRGDQQAFAKLYEAYQSSAFGAALLLTHDRTLAADVVQESFIKAFLAIHRFRPGHPFRPWLFRILTNEAFRLMKRRRGFWPFGPRREEEASPLPTPEVLTLDRERAEEIWKAISDLPDAARAAVAPGTIKARLSRAREQLKPLLAHTLKEEEHHA